MKKKINVLNFERKNLHKWVRGKCFAFKCICGNPAKCSMWNDKNERGKIKRAYGIKSREPKKKFKSNKVKLEWAGLTHCTTKFHTKCVKMMYEATWEQENGILQFSNGYEYGEITRKRKTNKKRINSIFSRFARG